MCIYDKISKDNGQNTRTRPEADTKRLKQKERIPKQDDGNKKKKKKKQLRKNRRIVSDTDSKK